MNLSLWRVCGTWTYAVSILLSVTQCTFTLQFANTHLLSNLRTRMLCGLEARYSVHPVGRSEALFSQSPRFR